MDGREMASSIDKVSVALGERSYDILIGQDLLAKAGSFIDDVLRGRRAAIVTDDNVARLHLPALQESLTKASISHAAIVLPPGEATKSYSALATLCDRLLLANIERRDLVIALGGGVIGDLAGFAAAILRRGVDFVQIPTTLLAQVDSSVGGKTGINSPLGKNLVGAFHQPRLVIADLDLLNTLPPREFAAGYAEVAKYGLLGDRKFFKWLDENVHAIFAGNAEVRRQAVKTSCEAKARIVAEDETETGVRAMLNLGHTFGHALEAAAGFSDRLLHGEAISIGMVQAFRFSERLGHCPAGTAERVAWHLVNAGLPIRPGQVPGDLPPPQDLVAIMRQDKKAVAGRLTFILARGIGEAFIARDVREEDVVEFLASDLASA
jgi:3-dehydroquinate synthase